MAGVVGNLANEAPLLQDQYARPTAPPPKRKGPPPKKKGKPKAKKKAKGKKKNAAPPVPPRPSPIRKAMGASESDSSGYTC